MHCAEITRPNAGLHREISGRAYPQNVNISDYELQILKNIFVLSVNIYLTREILLLWLPKSKHLGRGGYSFLVALPETT